MFIKVEINIEMVLIIPTSKCTLSYASGADVIHEKKNETTAEGRERKNEMQNAENLIMNMY